MKKTKYMMSRGLAFSEASDMKRLRKKSLQGWHLNKFSFLGYRLERGNPQDVIYTIDYRLLNEKDAPEYFEMFSFTGWEHVCSDYNMHIFKAPKGTKPIYSDVNTMKDKYSRLINPIQKVTVISCIILILLLMINFFTNGTIQSVSEWAIFITVIIFVPSVMTLIAAYVHRWKKYYKGGGKR